MLIAPSFISLDERSVNPPTILSIFIIMSSQRSFEKILKTMLPANYPFIDGVKVIDEYYNDIRHHKVFIGIKDGETRLGSETIRDYVKELSKYIFDKNEKVGQILFIPSDSSFLSDNR
jgi:hypothetical protein